MSTFSTSLQLQLIGNGEQTGTWGTTTNTNWNLIEQAVAGVTSITMLNADYTLTVVNGASDEARNMVLVVGGTNSAIRKIIAPLVTKVYVVYNNTSGGYAITVGGSTGSAVTVPNGASTLVYCDGTNFYGGLTGTTGDWNVPGTVTATTFSGAGTGLTGTASSLTVGTAINAGAAVTATSAASAVNLSGGNTGYIPYQSSAGSTSLLPPSTAGYVLSTNGAGAPPTWIPVSGGGGTVTSVGISGTNLSVSNSPITTSGTISISLSGSNVNSALGYTAADASATVNTSGNQSISGTKTFSTGLISANGYNFTSNDSLYWTGSEAQIRIGGAMKFFCSGASAGFSISDVQKLGGGTFNSYSDARLKENVADYSKGLSSLKQLRTVTYNYTGKFGEDTQGKTFTGLIAQEVENTDFAGMVKTGDDGFKTVDSSELVYALINAVKELSAEVDVLKAKLEAK